MPDPKLQALRREIEALLTKHDVAGVVILNSQTNVEYLVKLDTTWTALRMEMADGKEGIRFRLTKADVPDDARRKQLGKDTIGTLAGTIDCMKYLLETLDTMLCHAATKIEFSHISHREESER